MYMGMRNIERSVILRCTFGVYQSRCSHAHVRVASWLTELSKAYMCVDNIARNAFPTSRLSVKKI